MTLGVRRTPIGGKDTPFGLVIVVTVGLQVLTVGNSALHDRLVAALGTSWSDLASGRVWRLLTSSFVQTEPGIKTGIMVLLVLAAAGAFLRVEPRRVLLFWFLGDAVASVLLALSYRLLVAGGIGSVGQRLTERDAGSSSGAHAVMTAALLTLDTRRQRVIGVAGLAVVQIPFIAISHNTAYVHHLFAIATTVIAAAALDRWSP